MEGALSVLSGEMPGAPIPHHGGRGGVGDERLYKEEIARWSRVTFLQVTLPADGAVVRRRSWDTEHWTDKQLEIALQEVGGFHAGGGGSSNPRELLGL